MIYTIIIFILVLGVLVLVHELGHFVVARRNGVKVEEFGIGFPPRIFKIKRKETIYSLNWLPIGGFVKIKGEQGEDPDDEDSFAHKTLWQRTKIVSAGVIMNMVLAAVIFMIGFIIGIPQAVDEELSLLARVEDEQIQIVSVLEGSPAKEAGIETADMIVDIDGQIFNNLEAVEQYSDKKTGQEVLVRLKRGDEIVEKTVVPKVMEEGDKGVMGVAIAKTGIVSYPWYYAIWQGAKVTVLMTWRILQAFYELFKNLILHGELGIDVSGPVGIAVISGKVARMGIIYLMQFTAILSINLAIINFLPFPALDGGRVLFYALEKIRGKAISQKVENAMHMTGFALLMLLVLAVTFRDVIKYGGGVVDWVKNIF